MKNSHHQTSKLNDANGVPLTLYHTTSATFEKFRPSEFGAQGAGIYMTDTPSDYSGKTLKLNVEMRNPFYFYPSDESLESEVNGELIDQVLEHDERVRLLEFLETHGVQGFGTQVQDALKAKGHDGIIMVYPFGDPVIPGLSGSAIVIAFDPEQVTILPNVPMVSTELSTLDFPQANRDPGDVLEPSISTLPVFYHGTTRKAWRKRDEEPSYLYLTSSMKDAEIYAQEAGEAEYEDCGRAHPMVVKISPSALRGLLTKPGVELQPDWGWVEGLEHDARKNGGTFKDSDATWQNSLVRCSSVSLEGFQNRFKKLFDDVKEPKLDSPAP